MRTILACALFAAACAKQTGPGTTTAGTQPLQPGLSVSDDPHDFNKGNTFDLFGTQSLYVQVVEPTLPATTMLALKFTNPHGELFHEDHSPFTTNATPTMMEDGLMHGPMEAWPAQTLPGGYALVRAIAISGSNFTRIPQPDGAWGLTADVDGVPGQLSMTLILQH